MPIKKTRLHVEFDLDMAVPPSNKVIRSVILHDLSDNLSFFIGRYAKARNVVIHSPKEENNNQYSNKHE